MAALNHKPKPASSKPHDIDLVLRVGKKELETREYQVRSYVCFCTSEHPLVQFLYDESWFGLPSFFVFAFLGSFSCTNGAAHRQGAHSEVQLWLCVRRSEWWMWP